MWSLLVFKMLKVALFCQTRFLNVNLNMFAYLLVCVYKTLDIPFSHLVESYIAAVKIIWKGVCICTIKCSSFSLLQSNPTHSSCAGLNIHRSVWISQCMSVLLRFESLKESMRSMGLYTSTLDPLINPKIRPRCNSELTELKLLHSENMSSWCSHIIQAEEFRK